MIRQLDAPSEAAGLPEENAARVELARAGIAAVRPVAQALGDASARAFADQLLHRYESKITLREGDAGTAATKAIHIAAARQLRLAGIAGERERLYQLHAMNTINDEVLRVLEEELDERELMSSAGPRRG